MFDIFWKPKWKKEGKLTLKGSNKFINFKRDLITPEAIKDIRSRQQDLKTALKLRDQKEVKRKINLLEQVCKKSLASYVRPNSIAENTEIIFVTIVIALGLKAYFIQPFRIPTGSMQPTLNGINAHYQDLSDRPNLATRIAQMATHGRSYVDIIAEKDCSITNISEGQFLKFFTRAKIEFDSMPAVTLSASKGALSDLIQKTFQNTLALDSKRVREWQSQVGFQYKKGDVIARGFIESGDLVVVDKVSYHFRKPKRGETFVFDTREIKEIRQMYEQRSEQLAAQQNGVHYIKRCVGVPGDSLSIDDGGNIIVNDSPGQDRGLQYSMNLKYLRDLQDLSRISNGIPTPTSGYWRVLPDSSYSKTLSEASDVLKLKGPEHRQYAEYAAFGDNTNNSLDSRYWGPVRQFNLVGPALLSLWPFSHEIDPHWGFIK